jgi:sulfoxide reductase heme-binding subunit YedZ
MRGGGTAIVLAAGAAALVLAALCLALAGTDQDGTAVGLRATALLAFPFLVGTYAAPALAVLWPGKLSEWLLRRRRALGLAFAAVLAVHLALIVHLLRLPPSPAPTVLGLTPGFLAYLALAAMVLTSLSRVARAVGPERVRLLRRLGEQWVFAVFALALFKGVFVRHHYAWWLLPLMVALGAYAMRFEVWRRASPSA